MPEKELIIYSVYPPAASADLAIRRTNWSKANRLP
jgi:hypothetical protein